MDNKPGGNPMGGSKNYKVAFKTPGYTDFKAGAVVDVAHCKVSSIWARSLHAVVC